MSEILTINDIADFFRRTDPDPDEFDRILADDVTWELKGEGLEYARKYSGKAEVYGQYQGKLAQRMNPAETVVKTVDVFVDERQSTIIVHNDETLGLTAGESISVEVILLLRIALGQIVAVSEFMDLRPIAAAFGTSLDT